MPMFLGLSCSDKLVSAETKKWYRMEDLCGGHIDMDKDGVYTAVVKFHGAAETRNCVFSVSPGSWWNKLSFQITKHSNGGDSCLAFSQTEEGSKETREISGLYGRYCGSTRPAMKRQFVVDKLNLSYTPHSIQFYFYLTFEIVITVFKEDGKCDAYQCGNKRCIPNELQCSDYNPCGDDSHCRKDTEGSRNFSLFKVAGILVSLTVGAVVMMFVFKRCMSATNEESVDRESGLGDSPGDLEIQPMYNYRGTTGVPSYDSRDQVSRRRELSEDYTGLSIGHSFLSASNDIPSTPVQNRTTASGSRDGYYRTAGVELHVTGVQESDGTLEDIANNGNRESSERTPEHTLPPPSYESVMANEQIYKITH